MSDPHGFDADRRLSGISTSTIERQQRARRYLSQHAGCPAWLATRDQVRLWLADHPTTGGASFSLRAVRPYFGWLVQHGHRPDDPTHGIRVRVQQQPRQTATDDDLERMLRSASRSPRDLAVLSLLAATGCRRSEVGLASMADARDVIGEQMFRVRHSKSRPRLVPLDERAQAALTAWLELTSEHPATAPLWLVKNGPMLVSRAVSRHSDLSPHALRRAFCVRWLSAGGSQVGLGRIAGWSEASTPAMALLYSRASHDDLAIQEYRRLLSARQSAT